MNQNLQEQLQEQKPTLPTNAETLLSAATKAEIGYLGTAVGTLVKTAQEVTKEGLHFTFTPDVVGYRAAIELGRRALDVIEYELHQEEARELVRLSSELDILKGAMGVTPAQAIALEVSR